MKKILGNLLFLLSIPVFALSTASVNQTWFYLGEEVTLTLSSDGNKVVFPLINDIAGQQILYTSNAQEINIINSKRQIKSSKSYTFKPSKNLNIPAYTFVVDGIKQTTQPIKITLKTPTQTQAGDNYILQIKVDKSTFFLGDKINLDIIFKVKKSLSSANQINISVPKARDLLFIKSSKVTRSADENYNVHILKYKISANNFGTFKIPSLVATIGKQNNTGFGGFFIIERDTKSKKIYSNTLTLKVNPLPDTLRVFGDFTIKASIDKSQVKKGDAVNLTITIKGKGNFKDIEKFDFDIDNTTIYKDDSIFSYKDWQQKFALVGDGDFTIPSLSLEFFDKITQKKKRISTQPIFIQVKQSVQPIKAVAIETPKDIDTKIPIDNKLKYYYLLVGVFIGLFIAIATSIFKNKQQHKHQDLVKQIKSTKSDKQLFDLLLPLDFVGLKPILQQLEENLYKGKGAIHKINKKVVVAVVIK